MTNLFKKWRRQILFYLSASNHSWLLFYYRYVYRPVTGSIAHFLNNYSQNIKDGVLLQIGANDGITHDPVHKFIKRDPWRAVLLEPQKSVFDKHLSKIYARDTQVSVVNAALGKEDGSMVLYKVAFSESRWATGLASFQKEVVKKAFASGHVARQAAKEGVEMPDIDDDKISEEVIKVISLKSLRDQYDLDNIDLLQIDTEGYDFEIIKLFDLVDQPPGVIVYEHAHLCSDDQSLCQQHLVEHGYTLSEDRGNTLAIHSMVDATTLT